MKKNFRDIYLIGISFIAGVMFVIQCGGAAKSVAEAVTDALGITYSNSDSGLSAATVQAAIDELAESIPFVYDSSGNKVGVYVSDWGDAGFEMWDMTRRTVFQVEPATGQVIVYSSGATALYFESTDCTGTGYLSANSDSPDWHPVSVDGTLYHPKFGGVTKTESDISSTKNGTGTCASGFREPDSDSSSSDGGALKKSITSDDADNLMTVLVEAETVSEPTYGALFLK